MRQKDWCLVTGALLHDIGKIVYRQQDERKTHSEAGFEFLQDVLKDQGPEVQRDILECVRYHHGAAIRNADIRENSPAYIVYMADNIAAASDRRENETGETGFEIHTPLQPVFNILNENQGNCYYSPMVADREMKINYPEKEKTLFREEQYRKIVRTVSDNLKGMEWRPEYVNSLLEVLEANLAFIPSSTSKAERADISLYDHLKLTAAFAGCIQQYLEEKNEKNYRESLLQKTSDFYSREAFLLASLDVSGIQKFIYTISSDDALRTLRARSFYLEILMEHLVDELLEKLNLTRANLIYAGGGHCYFILPNTQACRDTFDSFMKETNEWFLENYQNALFIAGGYTPCCSNALRNIPEGSYSQLFLNVSRKLSEQKSRRYTADQILALNHRDWKEYGRECKVCRRLGNIDDEKVCPACKALKLLSNNVLYSNFFSILKDEGQTGVKLPGGFILAADDEESLKGRIRERREGKGTFVRAYSKNQRFTGEAIATHLWTGSYTTGETFNEFAEGAKGIKRIGILRGDVDNLGSAFEFGFESKQHGNKYVTLSRTATLSRQLSFFFKGYINEILKKPEFSLDGEKREDRKATIVYSGGDDVFIVGAWNEVIELAADLKDAFARYTEGTLTLSAGIGIYDSGYPISAIAAEVADMEDASKGYPGKNAVTLLEDGEYHKVKTETKMLKISDGTYPWSEFTDKVIGEKLREIQKFFDQAEEHGMSFMYRLLELIRNQDEPINFARYVYLLSRMEPDSRATQEQKDAYHVFSQQMIQWIQKKENGNTDDIRELKTALTIYAYLNREREENSEYNN